MVQVNSANQRLVFQNAAALLQANGYSVEAAKLTMSEVRSEVAMSASVAQYRVPVRIDDNTNGNPFPTERRLNTSDVFIVSSIGIYAAKPASATAPAGLLYTYGNSTVFSTSNCASSINNAYANGFLSLLIDNQQVMPYWASLKHLRVQPTQQAANAGYTASGVSTLDSFSGSADGVFPCEPNLVLAGNGNIVFNFSTVTAMTAVETASRWVFVFGGVLAQNCSKTAN